MVAPVLRYSVLNRIEDVQDDIVRFLQWGAIIVLYNRESSQVFHYLKEVDLSERWVIYIDADESPALMGFVGWQHWIHPRLPNVTELSYALDPLRIELLQPSKVLHKMGLKYRIATPANKHFSKEV